MLGNFTLLDILYVILSIVISLSIHEAMHAYASHLLGDRTAERAGRLSLNPLKHIDPFSTVLLPIITFIIFKVPFLAAKPVPYDPDNLKYEDFGAALVALAGPLTNLALAFIAAYLLRGVGPVGNLSDFLSTFLQINIAIFIFNIIPIPPLDGSRVLYAFAPDGFRSFMDNIEPYGIILVFILILTGVLTNLFTGLYNTILSILP